MNIARYLLSMMPARSAPINSIYAIRLRERYFKVVMRTAAVKPRDRDHKPVIVKFPFKQRRSCNFLQKGSKDKLVN